MPNKIEFFKEAENANLKAKPIIKWAGGKSQILIEILKYVPADFNRYIEPFIGGGAVFFALNHPNCIISDLNEELVNMYIQIRDNVDEVIDILNSYINNEQVYYQIRALNPNNLLEVERAARLIFLNKTCFNGLYRVNKKGEFNVPYNKRSGAFFNAQLLHIASRFLSNTEILHGDYKSILESNAEPDDFIFLDPPYHPISEYSDFKRYTKEFFYEKDQIELAEYFVELVKLGCIVILTNSNHPFVLDLYKDFHIEVVQSKRLISSNPNTRFGEDIIVIGGY